MAQRSKPGPKPRLGRTVGCHVRLREEQAAALDAAADSRKVDRSKVIREALDLWITQQRAEIPPSRVTDSDGTANPLD